MPEEIKKIEPTKEATEPKTEEELLKRIYQRFQKAKDAKCRIDFETDIKESKRSFKAKPFTESQETEMKEKGIPPVKVARGTTNALRFASILTAKRPELKALPIGRGDRAIANLAQRAFKKIWSENHGNMKHFKVVLGNVREGESHFNCYSEHFGLAGDVRIKIGVLGAKRVLFDPDMATEEPESWAYKINYRAISPEEAKDKYGLKGEDLYYAAQIQPSMESEQSHDSEPGGRYEDGKTGQAETVWTVWELEYYEKRKYEQKYWLDPGDSKEQPMLYRRSDDAQELETAKENLRLKYMVTNPDTGEEVLDQKQYDEHVNGLKPIRVMQTDLRYVLVCGKKIIEDKTNPYKVDSQKEPIDPIITLRNIDIGEVYSRGNMYFATGPLQEIAKRRGQSIAVVAATIGSPITVDDAKVILDHEKWRTGVTKPKEILHYKSIEGEGKPEALYQNIPDLSRVFQLEDRALQDLNDCFNLSSEVMRGESGSSRMSGRLAGMLKDFGMEGNSYLLTAVEEVLRKLGVCLISMAINEWPMRYWEALLEEEDKDDKGQILPEYVEALAKLERKEISIIDLDIGIRSGSSLPTSRMESLEVSIELATTPVPDSAVYDVEAVLNKIDDPEAQEVLKRKNIKGKMLQQMDKMGQDMKMMANQLEQVTKEKEALKAALDKEKITKVGSEGQMKFKYETTIEKMNLRMEALAKELGAITGMLKKGFQEKQNASGK